MKPVYLFIICCSVLALSLPAMAVLQFDTPSLGDVLGDGQFDGIGSSDWYHLSLNGSSGIHDIEFSLLGEESGFAKWNRMGIYDYANPSKKLEIFSGKDKVGASFIVTFDLDKGQAWIKDDKGKGKGKGKGKDKGKGKKKNKKISIGPEFGFYVDSGKGKGHDKGHGKGHDKGHGKGHGGLFYSESSLNEGADLGVPHALIFDVDEAADIIENMDMVIAFENTKIDAKHGVFDGDYNDMVVGVSVTGVTAVPEPATIAMLGFGYLIFLRKKK